MGKFAKRVSNRPPRNIMAISGDGKIINTLRKLRGKGYRTLSAFRQGTCNVNVVNPVVDDSFVWRQLMTLRWEIGNKRVRRNEVSGSAGEPFYYQVPYKDKFIDVVSFLRNYSVGKKTIIFFPFCEFASCHAAMLRPLKFTFLEIHGKQRLEENLLSFFRFKTEETCIFLCSKVMVLGSFMRTNWIIKFNKPQC